MAARGRNPWKAPSSNMVPCSTAMQHGPPWQKRKHARILALGAAHASMEQGHTAVLRMHIAIGRQIHSQVHGTNE